MSALCFSKKSEEKLQKCFQRNLTAKSVRDSRFLMPSLWVHRFGSTPQFSYASMLRDHLKELVELGIH